MKATVKNGRVNTLVLIVFISFILSIAFTIIVNAAPIGPTVTSLYNSTKNSTAAAKVNFTNNNATAGGTIYTMSLNSVQKNTRWKAYVGNVTGTFTLDDALDNTIYSWSISSISGEVYATRASGTINWTGINCTWSVDKKNASDGIFSNRSPEWYEQEALTQFARDDNITTTFNSRNHSAITVGSRVIPQNDCFTVVSYQKDAAQVFTDSIEANFSEIILYDAAFNRTNGNVVYATFIMSDVPGYKSDEKYDFQMVLPENGNVSFTGATAYYFYVELT